MHNVFMHNLLSSVSIHQFLRSIILVIATAFIFFICCSPIFLLRVSADENRSQVYELASESILNWQQIIELLQSGETADAVATVQSYFSALSNESLDGSLLATLSQPANVSFNVEYYRAAPDVVASKIRQWKYDYLEAWETISFAPQIRVADQIQNTTLASPIIQLKATVKESQLSAFRNLALIRLSDAYRIRGQFAAARAALERVSPMLRAQLPAFIDSTQSLETPTNSSIETNLVRRGSVPWYLAVKLLDESDLENVISSQITESKLKQQFSEPKPTLTATIPKLSSLWPDYNSVFRRCVEISIAEGDRNRAALELRFLENLTDKKILNLKRERLDSYRSAIVQLSDSDRQELENPAIINAIHQATKQPDNDQPRIDWPRFRLGTPIWSRPIRAITGNADATAANLPRVAESNGDVLAYQPVYNRERLFYNFLDEVAAYNLRSGEKWPVPDRTTNLNRNNPAGQPVPSRVSLFQSNVAFAAETYLKTPTAGVPRGRLTIAGDNLYARLGGQVTGWRKPSGGNISSMSQIVGLDLALEGKLLRGFPLKLDWNEYKNSEWEGQPIVDGERLFTLVTKRDRVQIERYAMCFDRWTGELIWESKLLAAGMPLGCENAELISHTQLEVNCDRLFCVTNLGAVVSLDKDTGSILWATKYPQTDASTKGTFPRSMRFRFRDDQNLLIDKSMLICMPQDCEEIFALDWSSGELIWCTQSQMCSDIKHLIGVKSGNVICAGDRLIWIDISTGQISSGFPTSVQKKPDEAPDQLRGRGRPTVQGELILFPAAGRIFVFNANINSAPNTRVRPLAEIQLGFRGELGMNIDVVNEVMISTTPNRILAYDIRPDNWRRSDRSRIGSETQALEHENQNQ